MAIEDDLKILARWTDASNGVPIELPSGGKAAFKSQGRLTAQDLTSFESAQGGNLPGDYRKLLEILGPSELFIRSGERPALEVHHPESIRSIYQDFMEEPHRLFKEFLPVLIDNRLQEIVVILLNRPSPNVLVVSHEMPPEDWEDISLETGLTTLADYIRQAVATEGRLPAH